MSNRAPSKFDYIIVLLRVFGYRRGKNKKMDGKVEIQFINYIINTIEKKANIKINEELDMINQFLICGDKYYKLNDEVKKTDWLNIHSLVGAQSVAEYLKSINMSLPKLFYDYKIDKYSKYFKNCSYENICLNMSLKNCYKCKQYMKRDN